MPQPETYTPSQIHTFLVTERQAMHGIQPGVFEQAQVVTGYMAKLAPEYPGIAGIQLLGSRVHGVSTCRSDVDIAVIRHAGSRSDSFLSDLRLDFYMRGILHSMIEIDSGGAVMTNGIYRRVPTAPEELEAQVVQSPSSVIGLLEPGLYDTPALRQSALMVAQCVAAQPASGRGNLWAEVQISWNKAYLGERTRMADKLGRRLDLAEPAIEQLLPQEVMDERIRLFGLPDFDEYYAVTTAACP